MAYPAVEEAAEHQVDRHHQETPLASEVEVVVHLMAQPLALVGAEEAQSSR